MSSGYNADLIVNYFEVLAKVAILYTIVYFKISSINLLRLAFDPFKEKCSLPSFTRLKGDARIQC